MRRILRWLLRGVGALLFVVALFLAFAYWRTASDLALRIAVDEPPLAAASDAQATTRGEHMAITRGCGDCHGRDLGGRIVLDTPPVGRLSGPNLTRGNGGVGARLDATNIERAVRHGIGSDGRVLLYMPASDYASLTDADVADIAAYVMTVPAVDRQMPPSFLGPLLRSLYVLGKLPPPDALRIDHKAGHMTSMAATATPEYGAYVAHACTGCHGERYSGGPIPGLPPSFPPARNLTPDPATGIGKWTKVDFYTAMREGKRPDGAPINPFMPWQAFAKMTDLELDALWAHLQKLEARPYGNR